MSETPPRYRTLDRPGPGLATIQEPEGRSRLWSLNLRSGSPRPCASCGVVGTRMYHRAASHGRNKAAPRLCRLCVEGTPVEA